MNWQGIPFKFLSETTDALNLTVTALPNLILKSDPDYKSALLTAGVSLIAGLIPAGIAVYTFRKNYRNLKVEREEQQEFLRKEREEQQKFLREERAAQVASLEADRVTQREIAEKNFNMQVLSANRQAWINKLRDLLSEYMAMLQGYLTAQYEFVNRKAYYEIMSDQYRNDRSPEYKGVSVKNEYLEAQLEFQKSMEHLNNMMAKEELLTSTIKLMLNREEKWYSDYICIFRDVSIICNTLNELDADLYRKSIEQMSEQIDKCLRVSQNLLKFEWDRVKKGE